MTTRDSSSCESGKGREKAAPLLRQVVRQTRAPLVTQNLQVEPTPEPRSALPSDRMLTLFSPRDDKETVETLHWYADLMGSANRILCMTFAFNLDDFFRDVLVQAGETLRYAVFDKNLETDMELWCISVTSPARSDGNITGLSLLHADLSGKRLELRKEGVPGLSRVAMLWQGDHAGARLTVWRFDHNLTII